MKIIHSQLRAMERYNIPNFKPLVALKEILDNKCIQIKEDFDKYSRIFLIRYSNKYLKVVTDYNVKYVKTVLPFNNEAVFLNQLIQKLSNLEKIVA